MLLFILELEAFTHKYLLLSDEIVPLGHLGWHSLSYSKYDTEEHSSMQTFKSEINFFF